MNLGLYRTFMKELKYATKILLCLLVGEWVKVKKIKYFINKTRFHLNKKKTNEWLPCQWYYQKLIIYGMLQLSFLFACTKIRKNYRNFCEILLWPTCWISSLIMISFHLLLWIKKSTYIIRKVLGLSDKAFSISDTR